MAQVQLLPPVSAYVERLAGLPPFKAGTEACLCGEPLQTFADVFAQSRAGGLSAHPKLPVPGTATSLPHCAFGMLSSMLGHTSLLNYTQVLSCTGSKSLLFSCQLRKIICVPAQVSLEFPLPIQITMHFF